MKKICVITAARSEYGLLKWLMKDVDAAEEYELQLVVTGGHLLQSQGYTVKQIEEDGFTIDYVINPEVTPDSAEHIAQMMAKMANGAVEAYKQLMPDYVCVLGDRYELLPFCNAAFVMRIPIIHISGGDVTEGALDDGIRNAITMLATYHFPGTREAADNIIRMRNSSDKIWVVGEPGLDAFRREALMERDELASNLGLDTNKKWTLMTFHPETTHDITNDMETVRICIDEMLKRDDYQMVITYSNADNGGTTINEIINQYGHEYPGKMVVIPSLGQRRYLSFMAECKLVIGNSSSGIVEAPHLDIPVVNVGNRQKGRYQCGNIIQTDGDREAIDDAIKRAISYKGNDKKDSDYWGDGQTSRRILDILRKEI